MRPFLTAAVLVAAAALLSSLDSRSDVRLLEIGDGDLELVPLDGAAGPESIIFDKGRRGAVHGRVRRESPQVAAGGAAVGGALLLGAGAVSSFARLHPSIHHASSLCCTLPAMMRICKVLVGPSN